MVKLDDGKLVNIIEKVMESHGILEGQKNMNPHNPPLQSPKTTTGEKKISVSKIGVHYELKKYFLFFL